MGTPKAGNKAKGRQSSHHKAKYERQRQRTERNKLRRRIRREKQIAKFKAIRDAAKVKSR